VQNLEKIITKDFYPDLPKLEAQAEYLDAVERKDTQKMWELQQKFSRKRTAFRTPGVCKKICMISMYVSYYYLPNALSVLDRLLNQFVCM